MLLAMLGSMEPSLWKRSAELSLSRVGTLGPYTSFEQAAAEIARLKLSRACADALKLAQTQYDLARADLAAARYPQAMTNSAQARVALLRAYCIAQPSMPGEFRGFWCHSATGVEGLDWDAAVGKLSENGFTAVIPNMLWGGVAFYNSQVLPVASQVNASGDLLAQCLAACKKYGVQCHVWKVNFNMGWPTDRAFKTQMQAAGRTQVGFDGKPEPDWLCPSHPDNRKLEIDSMVELARKYAIDGIHFDYIRYPDADHCFCPGCRKRFEQSIGQALDRLAAHRPHRRRPRPPVDPLPPGPDHRRRLGRRRPGPRHPPRASKSRPPSSATAPPTVSPSARTGSSGAKNATSTSSARWTTRPRPAPSATPSPGRSAGPPVSRVTPASA